MQVYKKFSSETKAGIALCHLTMNHKDLVNEMNVTTLPELFIRCQNNFALQEMFASDP